MMCPNYNEKIPTYKSYKAEKFEKAIARTKALRQSVIDSSLKEEDKKSLLNRMSKNLTE